MVKGRKLTIAERIVVGIGAAVVGGSGGCSDYGDMVAQELAYTGVEQAVISGVRNEIEGPRGTMVNVNNPASGHVLPPGGPSDFRVRRKSPDDYGLGEAFFCEYYVDQENWSTAFKNVKNVFRSDDKIRVVSI